MFKKIFTAGARHSNKHVVAADAIKFIMESVKSDTAFEIEVRQPKRNSESNDAMWSIIRDISRNLEWPHTVNGNWEKSKMSPESWKSVLTAAFVRECAMARGVSGGEVMIGEQTSHFSQARMGEFLEFITEFAIDNNVPFSGQ